MEERSFSSTTGFVRKSTAPHRLDGHLDVAVGAHEDDGQVIGQFDELLMELHAGEARHANVEDAAARHGGIVLLEKGLRARIGLHAPAFALDKILVGLAHAAVVVDDANERLLLDGISDHFKTTPSAESG